MNEQIKITAELKDLVSGHLKEITDQVNRMDSSIKNVGNGSTGSGGGIMGQVLGANLLTSAISKAGSAVVDFAKGSVQSYMQMEGYEARMTTLLHDRQAALMAIKGIVVDAQKTPFDLQSLIQGNSMLIGAGASAREARKATMDLGNAIAATGGGSDELNRMAVNLAQIKSIGKASALDVKQFMFANIPIYEMLAKSMKKTTTQVKDMDISYQDLTKALADARKEGGMFFNGLENASQTLTGQVSNLGDAWDQLKTSIGGSQQGILKDTVAWTSNMISNLNAYFQNSNKVASSISKYGGKDYSFFEKLQNFSGNLINSGAGGTKGNKDIAFQSHLEKTYLQDAMKDANSAIIASSKIQSLIAKVSGDKLLHQQVKGTGGMLDVGTEQDDRDIAILKGVKSQIKDIIEGFKKEKATEAEKSGAAALTPKKLETLAKANRPNQTVINIENLVREFSVATTNMKEAPMQVQEMIAKVLLSAVNDISVLPN